MRKLFMLLSLLVVASMVLTACGPGTPIVETVIVEVEGTPQVIYVTAEPEPAQDQGPSVLRIDLGTYPDIIDPQKSSFVNEIAHLKLIYEGLTRFDETLATVPGAAESWSYNDDATVLTFTLRPDLKYSDGTLLNAERFAYSIKRNINPETAGEYGGITNEVLGAVEWRDCGDDAACEAAAATVDASVTASHADGAACEGYEDAACNTLTLNLSKPAPYFHTVMGLWVTFPAKQENIEEGGEIWWNSSKYQIGNGPYVLQSLEPFVRGYFVPNQFYWRGVGQVDIEYSYITDSAVSFEAYKNNEFDIIGSAAEDFATIENDPQLKAEHTIYAGSCTIAIMFNLLREPFTDMKVREAFAYATDREGWARDVDANLSIPTLTWIPPGYPGFDPNETRYAYDPAAALQLISESSYGSVENLPEIELTFGDSPRNRVRNEWLLAKWKEVFGDALKITLNPVEPTTYTALTKDVETTPQVFRLGWCADYPDPQNWLSVYWRTGNFGDPYSNAEFDALVDAADSELDPAKRADLYQQAQQLLVSDVPVIFMYNTKNHYLVKPWVKGIKTTPQDAWPGDIDPISITIDESMKP